MTSVQPSILDILERHKPEGASWVVFIDDSGFKSTYGPFEQYDEAQSWIESHPVAPDSRYEVLPLYGAT